MQRRARSRAPLAQKEGRPQAPPLALAALAALAAQQPEAAASSAALPETPAGPELDCAAELQPTTAAALARRDPVLPTAAGRLAQPAVLPGLPVAAVGLWAPSPCQAAGAAGPLGAQAAPLYLRPFVPFASPSPQGDPYWPVASLAGRPPGGLGAPASQLTTASVLTWCHPLGSMPIMSAGPAAPGMAVPHPPSPFCWPDPRYVPTYRPPARGPADRADDRR